MAHRFGFRLRCIYMAQQSWNMLTCWRDGSFLLLKMFPTVFKCAESENEHKMQSHCKGVILLQDLENV